MKARRTLAAKFTASFSYRATIRRHSFSRPTTFRRRYGRLSKRGGWGSRASSSLRCGTTGSAPQAARKARIAGLLYPLPPATFAGRRSPPCGTDSTSSTTAVASRCWPGVRTNPSGRCRPSRTTCSLVPYPPRLRPRAWPSGSPAGRFFSRPRGRAAGPDGGPVQAPQRPIDRARLVGLPQQFGGEAVPGAALAPAVEAAVGGLPGAGALGQVAPGRAGDEHPEGGVEGQPVVLERVTPAAVRRQQRFQLGPLGVGQGMAAGHRPGPPAEGASSPEVIARPDLSDRP